LIPKEFIVEALNLVKTFGDKRAIDGISFSVNKGEVLVLLGPNGAGKTTIVRLLSSLFIPDSGSATIFGLDTVQDSLKVRALLGVLTELPGLYQRLNLEEYLEFFGRLYGISDNLIQQRFKTLSSVFRLGSDYSGSLESFSKGMRQKASLLRALIHDPPVVFLDEPTSALDPSSAKIVRDYLLKLKEEKKIIIVCTHNLTEAEYLADRIAIIRKGRLPFLGTIEQLKKRLLGKNRFLISYQRQRTEDRTTGRSAFRHDYIRDRGQKTEDRKEENYQKEIFKELTELFTQKKLPGRLISANERELQFESEEPQITNPFLIEYLIKSGLRITLCQRLSQSLESAYLKFEEDDGKIKKNSRGSIY